jgi:hypothetical protein
LHCLEPVDGWLSQPFGGTFTEIGLSFWLRTLRDLAGARAKQNSIVAFRAMHSWKPVVALAIYFGDGIT